MQVQHTVEFDDDLRFGVAQALTGEFRAATREECREWIANAMALPLVNLRTKVAEASKVFGVPKVPAETVIVATEA